MIDGIMSPLSVDPVQYTQLVKVSFEATDRQLAADAQAVGTGPGGHCGATLTSSAVDLPPHVDTSDQPLPGPAPTTLPAPKKTRKTTTPKALQPTP